MTVFHHAIKSLGTNYDPLAGKVVAHIVGGGSVGNTQFKDISSNNTPCVTVGSLSGAQASGPFGSDISLKSGATSALRLAAGDKRFSMAAGQPMADGFTADGWFKCMEVGPMLATPIFCLHGAGYGGGGAYRAGGTPNGLEFELINQRGTSTVYVMFRAMIGSNLIQIPQVDIPARLRGGWLYFHLHISATREATLRVHDIPAVIASLGSATFPTVAGSNYAITLGGYPNGSDPLNEFYAFRLTRGLRPYSASLLASPWPTQGGTTNWLGAPAGASTPVGQRVLGSGEVWVVPQGISHISAVAVGCKLSIAGTDVLAATWPVLGDGGGQGGAGGTGHSETVESWSNGPPSPGGAFGGTPGTIRSVQTYSYYGGGGGAGGYTGKGGNGVSTQGATASSGQGGGGGGGAPRAPGGGVGLKGQGASGTGGSSPGQPGSATGTTYGGGLPGAGATLNGTPGNNLAWRNNIPVTQGQVVLCTYIGQSGQTGAARIMWGDARSYPKDAGDVE